jgi:hypothetical protein
MANTQPIYSATPDIQSAQGNNSGTIVGNSANTAMDGSGANIYMVMQGGTNGSYIQKVIFKAQGSPGATVARIFVCSNTGAGFTGGTTNTTTNTWLVGEISLPAVTASQTTQSPTFELPLGFALPPSYKLLVTFGTATGASTGFSTVAIGGDY